MRELQWKWLWWAVGMCLVAGVIAGSLMPNPDAVLPVHIWDKFQHAGAYALLMLWFGWLCRRPWQALPAAALVGLGVALEFVQAAVGRDFSYGDMLADACGVTLAWVVVASPLGAALSWLESRLIRA